MVESFKSSYFQGFKPQWVQAFENPPWLSDHNPTLSTSVSFDVDGSCRMGASVTQLSMRRCRIWQASPLGVEKFGESDSWVPWGDVKTADVRFLPTESIHRFFKMVD